MQTRYHTIDRRIVEAFARLRAPERREQVVAYEVEPRCPVRWQLVADGRSEVETRIAGDDDDSGGVAQSQHVLSCPAGGP